MSKEDIWKRLHNVTAHYSETNTPSLFEGSISEKSFRLYQLFNYGNGNLIRPEINGEFAQKKESIELRLFFKFSTEMSIFFGGVLIINITLIIIQASTNLLTDSAMFPFGWKVYSGFSLAGYIITLLIYYNKVKECTEKFAALCKGKNSRLRMMIIEILATLNNQLCHH